MSDIENDLRKSLKMLYGDLLDAENGPDRQTFGFKNRLKVLYEDLQELESKICAEFGLGDFGVLDDFKGEYYRRGDSGLDQLLKSQIKRLAIETDTNLEGKQTVSKNNSDDDEPLEFDVSHEDHAGKIKEFISHKFVKSDQELADELREYLDKHNIYGYLAERKKEYDLGWDEKIKQDIESSDYLIAILTKHSLLAPSVHQEIGYAKGVKVPVRILSEEKEVKGVLAQGRDSEVFSRENFEKYLGNIIKDILKKGIRKKLNDKEKDELIRDIYRPCYNKIHDILRSSEFIDTVPDNPWLHLEPYLKIKAESDIRDLFDEYEKERKLWHMMWIDTGNKINGKRKEFDEILRPLFSTYLKVDQNGGMDFCGRLMGPIDWFLEYKDVLLNTEIKSDKELQQILKEYAFKKWGKRHSQCYDEWQEKYPSLYSDLLKIIPKLVEIVDADFTHQEIGTQRNKLKIKIEILTDALEEKLK